MTANNPTRTVLLVEDDPVLRRLMRKQLEAIGLEVAEVASGRAALDFCARSEPDLVCLDLMLPEMSGYEICAAIRTSPRLADLPVLVVSSRTLPEDRAYAEEAGASAYLTKPLRRGVLEANVRELLRGRPTARRTGATPARTSQAGRRPAAQAARVSQSGQRAGPPTLKTPVAGNGAAGSQRKSSHGGQPAAGAQENAAPGAGGRAEVGRTSHAGHREEPGLVSLTGRRRPR